MSPNSQSHVAGLTSESTSQIKIIWGYGCLQITLFIYLEKQEYSKLFEHLTILFSICTI